MLIVLLLFFVATVAGWRPIAQTLMFRSRQPRMMTDSTYKPQGFNKFVRNNPKTDIFKSRKFHHIEFYTGESIATYSRFMASLGMTLVAKSDFSTGNEIHASYAVQSGDTKMLFTAPYLIPGTSDLGNSSCSFFPGFDAKTASNFTACHGLGVRAVAVEVDDVDESFRSIVAQGGKAVMSPRTMFDKNGRGHAVVAEIVLYGDAVLRLINTDNFKGNFLPNFEDTVDTRAQKVGRFGIQRFDHIVGNVWKLAPVVDYLKTITGFHEFAEFVAEDVGTLDSGLNSVVLANDNEYVLLPINEPTFGTKVKSQIQTYLEQFQGEGVQHIALYTDDIFHTLEEMRKIADSGVGFTFMNPPPQGYYERVRDRLGGDTDLTNEQIAMAEKLGVLIDRDDQGILLQIFTKPVGDRPTVFLEIIQRLGCLDSTTNVQKPGCGGFGKGNFKDLFKSIEDYENSLGINSVDET